MSLNIRNVHLFKVGKWRGSRKSSFLVLFRILIQKYGYFRNFQKSRDVTIRWSRPMKLLKHFLDNPRVGWSKNNQFETPTVFADTRHKFENFIIFIFWFSHFCLIWEVCLMSANTFDVSNRYFCFIRPLGYLKRF